MSRCHFIFASVFRSVTTTSLELNKSIQSNQKIFGSGQVQVQGVQVQGHDWFWATLLCVLVVKFLSQELCAQMETTRCCTPRTKKLFMLQPLMRKWLQLETLEISGNWSAESTGTFLVYLCLSWSLDYIDIYWHIEMIYLTRFGSVRFTCKAIRTFTGGGEVGSVLLCTDRSEEPPLQAPDPSIWKHQQREALLLSKTKLI